MRKLIFVKIVNSLFFKLKIMRKISPKYMSFQEMKNEFPDSWLLIANPVSELASADIKSGYVLYKNKQKKRVSEKSNEIKFVEGIKINLLRIIFTGEIIMPKNYIVCL